MTTTPARRRAAGIAGTLATAALLVGCTAEPEEPEAREGPGPLTTLRSAFSFQLDDPASVIASVARSENAIAACMHAAGFEYWPTLPDPETMSLPSPDDPTPGTVEFAERYGYGVWDSPDHNQGTFAMSMPDPEHFAYLASMSATEREAYDTALSGPITRVIDDGTESGITFRSGEGCGDRGWQPVGTDTTQQAYLDGIHEEIRTFLDTIHEDPEFDDLNREWSACFREAGYEAASPTAAEQQALDDWLAAPTPQTAQAHLEQKTKYLSREIPRATADAGCREQVDYQARFDAIRWDLEQHDIDTHAAEIEAYRQAAAERLATPAE